MKPSAVREAAKTADAFIQQVQAESETTVAQEQQTDGPADTDELRLVQQVPTDDGLTPPADTTLTIEQLQVQLAHETKEREKAEDRWRSLDGIIRMQNEKLDGLRAIIAAGSAQHAPAAEPVAAEPPPAPAAFTQNDADQFGADLCEYIDSRVAAVVSPMIATVRADLGGVEAKLQNTSEVVALTQEDRFKSELTEIMPTWESLNEDDDFIAWLNANPLYYHGWRKAVTDLDAVSAAQVMQVYADKLVVDTANSPETLRQQELETQLAPPRARADSPRAAEANQPKQWRLSEIQEFYRSMAKPPAQRPYTQKEADKIERDIAAAHSENRVDVTS